MIHILYSIINIIVLYVKQLNLNSITCYSLRNLKCWNRPSSVEWSIRRFSAFAVNLCLPFPFILTPFFIQFRTHFNRNPTTIPVFFSSAFSSPYFVQHPVNFRWIIFIIVCVGAIAGLNL
jgi:hypothetical protein